MAPLIDNATAALGFTTILKAFDPVWLFVSFTCAVKDAVPAAVGVPEIAPPEDNVKPAGRVPLVRLQE